jgi:hypothetical protein
VREYDALAVAKNTSMFLDEKTKKKHDGILVTDPPYVFFDFLHVRAAEDEKGRRHGRGLDRHPVFPISGLRASVRGESLAHRLESRLAHSRT